MQLLVELRRPVVAVRENVLAQQDEPLPEQGPLGPELPPPVDPVQGHPGDLPVG